MEYCIPVLPYPLRVQVAIRRDGAAAEYGLTAALLPIVGTLTGLIWANLIVPLQLAWPRPIAVLVLWLAWAWVNSPKVDGIADFCDGFSVKRSPVKTLEIMTDPRIGAIGGLGMIGVLVADLVCLTQLPAERWAAALVCTSALAKWAAQIHLYRAVPAQAESKRIRRFVDGFRTPYFLASSLLVASCCAWLMGPARGAAMVIAVALVALVHRRAVVRRIRGITGDTIASSDQFTTLAALLIACTR